jgi:hypothetical protein
VNALLARVADLDPDYVKHHRRQQWTLGVAVGAAIISLAVAVVVLSSSTRSACEENPAGHQCQQTNAASERHQTVRNACIRTLKTGYPCPKPGSRVAREHPGLGKNGGGVLRAASPPEGVVTSNGHAPSSQPGPPSGGHSGGSGHSGHHAPLTPSPTPAPAPPVSENATPLPGSSGDGESANRGVKACVEVIASACVKAEAELPLHP